MTTNNRHTPGPWIEFQDAESHDIIALDGSHIARVEPVNSMDPETEEAANALLLAAAPVMLDALRLAADTLQPPNNDEEREALRVIYAAIESAT